MVISGMALTGLAADLAEARERTLSLVAALSDDEVHAQHTPIMGPLAWDLAHIAAYEDLWIVHRLGREPLLHPELAAMYDAFETPRIVRGELPLLRRAEALAYLAEVRERALDVLERGGPDDGGLAELVLRHEHQHGETMLQAMELAGLPWAAGRTSAAPGPATGTGLEPVEVPAGPCTIGAGAAGFAYDNERPRHRVELPAYRIGRTPITNATFLAFVEGGGYVRREWWTDEGWAWKEEYDITHPGGRTRLAERPPDAPAMHVSWFEADALARAHGARLPTEQEWEKAATWDQETRTAIGKLRGNLDLAALAPQPPRAASASPAGVLGLAGDVWEWTASEFAGYCGFRAHPYREYSQAFFGRGHRVLRGGSWATRARVATLPFRNWDLPERRQLFAGLRLAWDA